MTNAMLSRRALFMAPAAIAGAAYAGPLVAQTAGAPFFAPADPHLGLQLYTLGPEAFTDLDATFTQVAAIGYKSVELMWFCNHTPQAVKAGLDRAGLLALSTQITFQALGVGYDLTAGLEKSMDAANMVGLRYIVASIFAYPDRFGAPSSPAEFEAFLPRTAAAMTADDWKAYADRLNATGAKMKPRGLKVGHHNHNVDFTPVSDLPGVTGYDLIARNIDPDLVTLELDIGWVVAAGLHPVSVLQRYSGRFSLMHVKDLKASTRPNLALKMDPAVAGEGAVDLKAILPAGRAAGVQWFFVEQEPPFAIPRLEAARRNYDYLARLRV